jgi:hypothetical protein
MAQPRSVIKSVEEATCGNCIYSKQDVKLYCARRCHVNVGYDCADQDYCGEGQWIFPRTRGETTWLTVGHLDEVYGELREWGKEI